MGSITTSHVTLKRRCAGARARWTSTPGTIQSSTRQSTSASPPTSMDLHTPTRSDYDYTVRSAVGLSENQLFVYIHRWRSTDRRRTVSSVCAVTHFIHVDVTLEWNATRRLFPSVSQHSRSQSIKQHFFHIFYTMCYVVIWNDNNKDLQCINVNLWEFSCIALYCTVNLKMQVESYKKVIKQHTWLLSRDMYTSVCLCRSSCVAEGDSGACGHQRWFASGPVLWPSTRPA